MSMTSRADGNRYGSLRRSNPGHQLALCHGSTRTVVAVRLSARSGRFDLAAGTGDEHGDKLAHAVVVGAVEHRPYAQPESQFRGRVDGDACVDPWALVQLDDPRNDPSLAGARVARRPSHELALAVCGLPLEVYTAASTRPDRRSREGATAWTVT